MSKLIAVLYKLFLIIPSLNIKTLDKFFSIIFVENFFKLSNLKNSKSFFHGAWVADEIIISYYSDGTYEKTRVDFSNRYNFNEIVHIKKFDPEKAICVVYYNGKQKAYYIKKFNIETSVIDKKYKFISGPFVNKIFKIIEMGRYRNTIMIGNIRTVVNKNKNCLYQPI